MLKQKYLQAICQCSALIVFASLLAFSINYLRNDSLQLLGNWSPEARLMDPTGKRLDISLPEAKKSFLEQSVIFIDARPQADYKKGHIKGALSLPWNEVDRNFMQVTEDISSDTPIISYCDGETCELSHDLAIFLLDMGFSNVRILINGWALWKEEDLPMESGSSSAGQG
ncbi:MAG: rhodanese-like domain-containing protein [Deltaproteobacteria bacterium]|nr:rhodanese-like domain-containing protein [Deltaproteobacteria bacterium]